MFCKKHYLSRILAEKSEVIIESILNFAKADRVEVTCGGMGWGCVQKWWCTSKACMGRLSGCSGVVNEFSEAYNCILPHQ